VAPSAAIATYNGGAIIIKLDLSSLLVSVGLSFLAALLYAFH
jgi:hypothetical protein